MNSINLFSGGFLRNASGNGGSFAFRLLLEKRLIVRLKKTNPSVIDCDYLFAHVYKLFRKWRWRKDADRHPPHSSLKYEDNNLPRVGLLNPSEIVFFHDGLMGFSVDEVCANMRNASPGEVDVSRRVSFLMSSRHLVHDVSVL